MKPFSSEPILPDSRNSRRGPRKSPGRICKSKNCETVLSIYNDAKICAGCAAKVPLIDLPMNIRRHLGL